MTGAASDPLDRTDMEAWGALTYERFVALVEIARAARDVLPDLNSSAAHDHLKAALARLDNLRSTDSSDTA